MSTTLYLSVTMMISSGVMRYAIWNSEIWRNCNRDAWRDPILSQLFRMGIFNWEGEDTHLHQANQAIGWGQPPVLGSGVGSCRSRKRWENGNVTIKYCLSPPMTPRRKSKLCSITLCCFDNSVPVLLSCASNQMCGPYIHYSVCYKKLNTLLVSHIHCLSIAHQKM